MLWHQSSGIRLLLGLKPGLVNAPVDFMPLLPRQLGCDSSCYRSGSFAEIAGTHPPFWFGAFRSKFVIRAIFNVFLLQERFFIWHIAFSCRSLTCAITHLLSGRTLAYRRELCGYPSEDHIAAVRRSCNAEGGSGSKCWEGPSCRVCLFGFLAGVVFLLVICLPG